MPAGLDGNPDPVVSADRSRMLALLADAVPHATAVGNVLVGIDGASGTGKSTLADELAGILTARRRPVVRASIDSFHRPRAERYARGPLSADGYYRDSHDLTAVVAQLLEPFAAGLGRFRTEAFDEPTDQPVDVAWQAVPTGAVLVFDGLFVHRPELAAFWDASVFLQAEQRREEAWQAYLQRDLPPDPETRAAEIELRITRARRSRYTDGQALYEAEASPTARATFVIDNDDLCHPVMTTRR